MKINKPLLAGMAALLLAGCATQHSSKIFSQEQSAPIKTTDVRAFVLNGKPQFPGSSGTALNDDRFSAVQMSFNSVPPRIANTVSGSIGTGLGFALVGLVAENSIADHKRDTDALLKDLNTSLDDGLAARILKSKLDALMKENLDIGIRLASVGSEEVRQSDGMAVQSSKFPVLSIGFEQVVPRNFSTLRFRLRAEARSPDGELLFAQNYYYLPVSTVPGDNDGDRVAALAANRGELYERHLERGIGSLIDALRMSFFSYRSLPASDKSESAKPLLQEKHCYTWDYDVGIHFDEYKDGRILSVAGDHNAVRLMNNDVIVFPKCRS